MSNEIVEVRESSIPALSDDTLIGLAEQAEKRVDALVKIKKAALRVTNAYDWSDQGGKPYMEASGSQKVGRVFGVSWRSDEPVYESEEGGHFSYTYTGEFGLAGATITAIGTRSSKDKFFTKYDYSQKDENGKALKVALPPSEIDKGDVKKSAYTNWMQNGIKAILGMKNVSWDDLASAGITKEQVSRVDFKKGGKKEEEIHSEGALTVNFIPSDVKKTGGKNEKTGKSWTKFIIKGPDGDYNTFSESFAKSAVDAKTNGLLIGVTYTTGKYGNEIENLGPAVYPPKEEDKEEAV